MIERTKALWSRSVSGKTLKARALRGGAWLGSGSFIEQFARFARNIVLVRMLAPQAFGLMAIILSITSMVESFTDVGSREALIQNPRGSEKEYVGAAWWLAFGRALTLFTVIEIAAPWIAKFYQNPELTLLLRVAAITVLFNGAMSSRAYVALKEMQFSKWAFITHGGGIIGVVTTLISAFFIRDVWALVSGFCMEGVARCTLSYIVCPFLPPLHCDRDALRELLKFSKGVFGLSFLNLIFARADVFVLAKLYSPTDLGLYAMAVYLAQVPTGFIMSLLGQIFMPAFSETQHDSARTNRILLHVTSSIALLGLPAAAFVFFCGRSILTLTYGVRYAVVAVPLTIAACSSVANLLNGQITTVFYAKGRPQLHRTSVALTSLTVVLLIYPMAKWLGLAGGQVPCLIAILAGYGYQVWRVREVTGLNLAAYAKLFVYPGVLTAATVGLYLLAMSFGFSAKPIPNLAFGALVCFMAYGAAYLLLFRNGSMQGFRGPTLAGSAD